MKLKDDWKLILKRAWSIRLSVLAAIVSGASLYWFVLEDEMPPRIFFAVGVGLSLAAAVARLIDQGWHDDPPAAS